MQRRPSRFNLKRKIKPVEELDIEYCLELSGRVKYGGNPEHKKNPGDFGLTPPSRPRAAKSLCDIVEIFSHESAIAYLKKGIEAGMISERTNNGWPQNIWAVTDKREPLEAQLENSHTGVYHGYPMPPSDPLSALIIKEWEKRNGRI